MFVAALGNNFNGYLRDPVLVGVINAFMTDFKETGI